MAAGDPPTGDALGFHERLPGEFTEILWRSHRAVGLCCSGALPGQWRRRPVPGFVATHDRRIVHAVAMPPGGHVLDKEPDA
ncbi:hypothetical protein HFP72_29880 [Nocardiopsis sp. ARC36]